MGVDRNPQKAFEFYESAAAQCHASSQHKIGRCYANGDGVGTNPRQAVEFYEKAAAQGYADDAEAELD